MPKTGKKSFLNNCTAYKTFDCIFQIPNVKYIIHQQKNIITEKGISEKKQFLKNCASHSGLTFFTLPSFNAKIRRQCIKTSNHIRAAYKTFDCRLQIRNRNI